MKLTKLATLMTAGVSCAYLTQCTTPSHLNTQAKTSTTVQSNEFNYPHTRTHQDHLDHFLHGEYGYPNNAAAIGNAQSDTPRADDGIDRYAHGVHVDKYRWLEEYDPIDKRLLQETTADRDRNFIGTRAEDDRPLAAETTKSLQKIDTNAPASEVDDWVQAQNKVTHAYMDSIPVYAQLRKNEASLYNRIAPISSTTKKGIGEIKFYRHADGIRRIDIVNPAGETREIFKESTLSQDGNTVITSDINISTDGTYLAFFARAGNADTDDRLLYILKTATGEIINIIKQIPRDHYELAWIDDDSFYYNAYDESWQAQIYRHDIGVKRFNDPIEVALKHIEGSSVQGLYLDGTDDEPNRYLIIDAWNVSDTVYIKDLHTKKVYRLHDKAFYNKHFAKSLSFNIEILAKLVHFDPKTRDVWLISGENNLKGDIIKTNLDNLDQRTIVVAIPEEYDITRSAAYHEENGKAYFLVNYLQHGVSRVVLVDGDNGQVLKDLTPPQGAGHVSKLSGHTAKSDTDTKEPSTDSFAGENYIKFRFSNPTFPETDYKYSIAKDKFIDVRRHNLSPFDHESYETKLVLYTSKDGVKVPMNISYKKGTKLDGTNPTLLYGYGGYGVTYDQIFGFPANTVWLESGGVWAHALIRGGGEYGSQWQRAAQHKNRLVGYDDFAAAADYLVEQGWTSNDKLGIVGGSNGGLLIGAAMVRHPEKYRVAFPQVPVLDALRHEKMGTTTSWMEEWGTPEEGKSIYQTLMSYSPYHNIKDGVCYPSTLIMTSKRDDRVVPSHAYKFAAIMQEKQSPCHRPAYLYAAKDQGHSPNTFAERRHDNLMVVAFALNEMGIKSVPAIEHRPSVDDLKTPLWKAEEAAKQARYEENKRKATK